MWRRGATGQAAPRLWRTPRAPRHRTNPRRARRAPPRPGGALRDLQMAAAAPTPRHTLLVVREVTVFQIPPATGRGHRAADWRLDAQLFKGRLRVEAVSDDAEIRLEDGTT